MFWEDNGPIIDVFTQSQSKYLLLPVEQDTHHQRFTMTLEDGKRMPQKFIGSSKKGELNVNGFKGPFNLSVTQISYNSTDLRESLSEF